MCPSTITVAFLFLLPIYIYIFAPKTELCRILHSDGDTLKVRETKNYSIWNPIQNTTLYRVFGCAIRLRSWHPCAKLKELSRCMDRFKNSLVKFPFLKLSTHGTKLGLMCIFLSSYTYKILN